MNIRQAAVKKTMLITLAIIVTNIGIVFGQSKPQIPQTTSEVKTWIDQNFAKGKLPPFAFSYGGRSSADFIRGWKFSAEKLKITEANTEETLYCYTDNKTGLVVKCIVTNFTDFPAVEWVIHFSNTSAKSSPILEKAAVIDHPFIANESGTYTLHHNRGSDAQRNDFQPIDEKMKIGKPIYMTPIGGRSSDNTAFPFFNIEAPGQQGVIASVGWTGKWYAELVQSDEKTLWLKSGMEHMKLTLLPGEEIRTPKISLLFWQGADRMVGHNQFRQFILAHHSRKIENKFAEYPLAGSFDYGDPEPCGEYNCLTEEFAIALIKRYQQFKILPEVFWLDAGWYTGCGWDKAKGGWWQNVGNWTVDKERFPHGLKPVSDAAHAVGSRFMVWFEPERVSPGTMIDREHPEWLIKLPGNENALFDLGNKDALAYMTALIGDLIQSEGIDNYRQDFNFDPMPYWQANDKPNRIGISEIRHIEGLYAFWDSLLARFPNLLIDNCASGGRRLDLETTSRSSPLWRTDYQYGEPNGYQCHTFGLNLYLPIHGTAIYKTDSYTFRSGIGATAVMNWEVTGKASEPIPALQKRIQDFKDLRPYFYGDYYPLTESRNNTGDNVWLAYQMNRPIQKDGIIIAFRRSGSNQESIRVKLSGVERGAIYELNFEDYGLQLKKAGSELMEGIDLTIPQKPASLLIRYHQIH